MRTWSPGSLDVRHEINQGSSLGPLDLHFNVFASELIHRLAVLSAWYNVIAWGYVFRKMG